MDAVMSAKYVVPHVPYISERPYSISPDENIEFSMNFAPASALWCFHLSKAIRHAIGILASSRPT